MLAIKRFIFGLFETNTYVVSNGQQVLLIDPACAYEWEQQELLRYMEQAAISHCPLSIIATHGHLDHLWGARWTTETWHTPVLMHTADIPMAQAMQQQYDLFGIRAKAEEFPIGGLGVSGLEVSGLEVIETPGHTPGSVCLYWPEDKVLLSGDTLFRMGYGRTDLPGGDTAQLIASLEKLFALPAEVQVYPGHSEATTIGEERR